jgi:hypothetical protein
MSRGPHPLRDRVMLRVSRGDFATVREIMVVASLPRATVCRWLREARIDLGTVRMRRLAKLHDIEERYLAGLPAKRKPTKALLHWIADRAKRKWDARNAAQPESVSTPADELARRRSAGL